MLWITSEYRPRVGGIERLVEDTVDALAEECDVFLVTALGQGPRADQRVRHVAALNLAYPRSESEWIETGAALERIVEEAHVDVVHFASAGLAAYHRYLGPVPFLVTVHCKDLTRPWQLTPGRDVHAAIAEGLAAASGVLCVSEYTRGHVARALGGAARSEVLTPATSMAPAGLRRTSVGPPGVLTVGKCVRRKGHLELMHALERTAHPFVWHVVGDGPHLPELEASIERSPIRERVRLHGRLDDARLEELWRASTVFALTPIELVDAAGLDAEGFGLVFLEAAMRRLATLTSTRGGCAEAVLHTSTGLVVDPARADVVAAALDSLLGSPATVERLGAAGREWVRGEFTWPSRARRLVQHYVAVRAMRSQVLSRLHSLDLVERVRVTDHASSRE